MASAAVDTASSVTPVRVTRSRRPAIWGFVVAVVLVILLAALPYVVYADVTDLLVNAFILLVLASMWNLLAGYCGLISVGQQAYVGVGAYTVLVLAQNGLNPFLAIPAAIVVAGVIAIPVSFLVFRLRAEYFAIGTWVVAEVFFLVAVRFPSLGAGTGTGLPGLSLMDPAFRGALTYWAALAITVVALLAAYVLLRSRMGLDLTAIRDNEVAARSVGVGVTTAQRIVYVVSAAGCGAAGALIIISQLNVQAIAIFNVSWSAKMIFISMIGGLGSIEGPILGTVIYFAIQQPLAQLGTTYFIVLGGLAVLVAMFLPRGIWGLINDRLHLQIFPVGYWLHQTVRAPSPLRGGSGRGS